jgi:hypothetical protein
MSFYIGGKRGSFMLTLKFIACTFYLRAMVQFLRTYLDSKRYSITPLLMNFSFMLVVSLVSDKKYPRYGQPHINFISDEQNYCFFFDSVFRRLRLVD